MNRLAESLRQLQAGNKKAFVPYIMAGDGGLECLADRLVMLEWFGASSIEVGIPFSDPVADGPVNQEAGLRSLARGTTLKGTLEQLARARASISIPIIVMTYLNPILAYGIDEFCRDSKEAGIDGIIIPDLPIEEEGLMEPSLVNAGIELIRLVTLTTPPERIREITDKGNGFVYAVTVKGITGGRDSFQDGLAAFLAEVKSVSRLPVFAGFGVSTPAQARELASLCDGVISGSRIVELLHEGKMDELEELVSCFKKEKESVI
ncbi:tryptophan synthase subunit alpha [Neobacillus piezotolerans]|uniref:Tryptophan synthase alpha chain n=1 Tax=Neobacillus piezotolerans TaxID=2259171 RepID=A0A3D8GQC2_9BACI|nr:tryptophan synthase subunit alpha [Neobacillus piezotolerans]RDU36481.1 tryptophan synthase subunit alpha [Neobacillus piezotolerans]